jgi:hypothetical protein
MVSYASGTMTFQEACDTVLELVEGISAISVQTLKSMSMAMVLLWTSTAESTLTATRFKNYLDSAIYLAASSRRTCQEQTISGLARSCR